MGVRIYGYASGGTSTGDVSVRKLGRGWALDTISIPIDVNKRLRGEFVEIDSFNGDIGTSWEDCSNFNQNNNYFEPSVSKSGFHISSSSSEDNHWTNGNGSHVVRIGYLDSNWEPNTIDVPISGQSKVSVDAEMFRINGFEVIKASGSLKSAGDIKLASGSTVYKKIESGRMRCRNGYYYVPSGRSLVVTDSFVYLPSAQNNKVWFEYWKEVPRDYDGTTYYTERIREMGIVDGTYETNNKPENFNMSHLVNEKCRIRIRCRGETANMQGGSYVRGYLIHNNV